MHPMADVLRPVIRKHSEHMECLVKSGRMSQYEAIGMINDFNDGLAETIKNMEARFGDKSK